MEGSRLILNRKPKVGTHRLFVALAAGLSIASLIMFIQLKTTLSRNNLAAVKDDMNSTRMQFEENQKASHPAAGSAEEDLDTIKATLEEALKAQITAEAVVETPAEQVAGDSVTVEPETETTSSLPIPPSLQLE